MLDNLQKIAELIDQKNNVFILTGSKLAQTLNIPDFRNAKVNGCSSCSNPCEGHDKPDHECHGDCGENAYRVAFTMLQRVKEAKPAAIHNLLAQLEQMKAIKGVITENIDSLHHLAGSQKIIELAGNLRQAVCASCHKPVPISTLVQKIKEKEMPPKCACGGVLATNISSMYKEDSLPIVEREMEGCELLVVVGSDLNDPLFKKIIPLAKEVCIINNENTEFDGQATVVCHGAMQDLLNGLIGELEEQFCLD